MIWTLTALALACSLVCVDAEGLYGTREQRTMAFSRSSSDDQDGNFRTKRVARSLNSNFEECLTPVSPREFRALDSNTYETVFHGDEGSSFLLTWVGDGTGVILVLSTVGAPSFYEHGSIRLYRSEDYGKSFHDISFTINSSFIRQDFGIAVGPGNSQKVILTAELPTAYVPGGVIFTSRDSGKTFRSVQLPFHPAQTISYHDQNSDCLVVISTDGGLWLSLNFGNSWAKIHTGVYSFTWGPEYILFFSYSPKGTVGADRRGDLFLRRTKDLGKTFSTIAQNIFSFGHIGGFLFTSVMESPGSPRALYVSTDLGDRFTKAVLPTASTDQFYSVLDADDDMIFMHVDSPGDETYFGTVYTSDDRGILFSKSLEHHLFGTSKSDFTNVTSLRGVYLTNVFEGGMTCSSTVFILDKDFICLSNYLYQPLFKGAALAVRAVTPQDLWGAPWFLTDGSGSFGTVGCGLHESDLFVST